MYDPGLHKDTSRKWDFSGTPGPIQRLQEGLQDIREEKKEGREGKAGKGREVDIKSSKSFRHYVI